jgi:hypothetical protein
MPTGKPVAVCPKRKTEVTFALLAQGNLDDWSCFWPNKCVA